MQMLPKRAQIIEFPAYHIPQKVTMGNNYSLKIICKYKNAKDCEL